LLKEINILVPSKDRPAQLDLLLRSMEKHFCTAPYTGKPTIIFKATSGIFYDGYTLVGERNPGCKWIGERFNQNTYKDILIGAIDPTKELTVLFVDDNIFINKFDINNSNFQKFMTDPNGICFSLRLNPKITYSYTCNNSFPPMEKTSWIWVDQPFEYGYPMSFDGHIYRTEELLDAVSQIDFDGPPMFESELAKRPIPKSVLWCDEISYITNVANNRVQKTFPNRHGEDNVIDLCNRYLMGERIRLEPFEGMSPTSCHIETPFQWEVA